MRKHLNISEQEIVVCALSFGYPDYEKIARFAAKQPKREVSDIVEFYGI